MHRASIAKTHRSIIRRDCSDHRRHSGMSALAYGLTWNPRRGSHSQEAIPPAVTTWKTDGSARSIVVKFVAPRERFITADDFLRCDDAERPVSVSLYAFDNARAARCRSIACRCHCAGRPAGCSTRQPAAASLSMSTYWAPIHVCSVIQMAAQSLRHRDFSGPETHTPTRGRPVPFY